MSIDTSLHSHRDAPLAGSLSSSPSADRVRTAFMLGGIVLLGAALRFKGLTVQSYWEDELFSAHVSQPGTSLHDVIQQSLEDVHPPLFQLLLWLWYQLAGFTELSGRLLAAIVGVLGIPCVYLLGREVKSRAVGLIAAAFCAVNYFHIYYSQEVRSYGLLFLLSTLSFLFYLKLIKADSRKYFWLYLASAIALIYTHLFGVLVVLAQMLAGLMLCREKPYLKKYGITAAVILLAAVLPLVPFIIQKAALPAFWIPRPSADFALHYWVEYFKSPLLASFILITALYGFIRQSEYQNRTLGILMIWMLIIYMLPFFRSLTAAPMLTSRNTIVALPALLVLSAMGVREIKESLSQYALLATFLLWSVMTLVYDADYYRAVTKTQVRDAAHAVIDAHPEAGTLYSSHIGARNFNTYFALLHVPLHVEEFSALEDSIKQHREPAQFLLIDAQKGPLLQTAVLSDPNFRVSSERKHLETIVVSVEQLPNTLRSAKSKASANRAAAYPG